MYRGGILFVVALAIAIPCHAGSPVPMCVKYVYLDVNNPEDHRAPLFACADIQDQTATKCNKVGSIDIKEFEKAEDRVLKQIKYYGAGFFLAMGCTTGAYSMLTILGQGVGSIFSVLTDAAQVHYDGKIMTTAERNVLMGTREPGTPPSKSRGEVGKPPSAQVCDSSKYLGQVAGLENDPEGQAAFRAGFNLAIDNAGSAAAQGAVLFGDAEALKIKYAAGPERDAAFKRLNDNVVATSERQKILFEAFKSAGQGAYDFMMSPTGLPFGISAEGVKDDLKCFGEAKLKEVAKLRGIFCAIASATGMLEDYKVGDLYEQTSANTSAAGPTSSEKLRQIIKENCEAAAATTKIEEASGHAPAP